ncbi:MAG: glycosyltransferase family 2 protein [Verrucomicrobiota bacterium]
MVPKVSVVVVDYRGQRFWGSLLTALRRQTYRDFELVVVDNHGELDLSSGDCGVEIRVHKPGANLGFSRGCNYGARRARGEYIVLLNNDTVPEPGWLEGLFDRIDKDDSLAVAVSKVLFYPSYVSLKLECPVFRPSDSGDGKDERNLGVRLRIENNWRESSGYFVRCGMHWEEAEGAEIWRWTESVSEVWLPCVGDDLCLCLDTPFESVGGEIVVRVSGKEYRTEITGEIVELRVTLDRRYLFDVVNNAGSELREDALPGDIGIFEKDNGQYNETRELGAFCGCSVILDKEVFLAHEGFDESFFAYYEDTDLSWRLQKSGYRILYEPRSVVRHHRSGTGGELSPFSVYMGKRNRFWTLAKHTKLSVLLKCLWEEFEGPQGYRSFLTDERYSYSRLRREILWGCFVRVLKRLVD